MTTVSDPGTGSEATVFNKDGTAILNITISGTPVTVPAVAGRVIVNAISPTPGQPYTGSMPVFNLSPDFKIGDEVWIVGQLNQGHPNFRITFNVNDEASNLILQAQVGGFIKTASGNGTPPNWLVLSEINSQFTF